MNISVQTAGRHRDYQHQFLGEFPENLVVNISNYADEYNDFIFLQNDNDGITALALFVPKSRKDYRGRINRYKICWHGIDTIENAQKLIISLLHNWHGWIQHMDTLIVNDDNNEQFGWSADLNAIREYTFQCISEVKLNATNVFADRLLLPSSEGDSTKMELADDLRSFIIPSSSTGILILYSEGDPPQAKIAEAEVSAFRIYYSAAEKKKLGDQKKTETPSAPLPTAGVSNASGNKNSTKYLGIAGVVVFILTLCIIVGRKSNNSEAENSIRIDDYSDLITTLKGVIISDGLKQEQELAYIRMFLSDAFGLENEQGKVLFDKLNDEFNSDTSKTLDAFKRITDRLDSLSIDDNSKSFLRKEFFNVMKGLANSNGEINKAESKLLNKVINYLGDHSIKSIANVDGEIPKDVIVKAKEICSILKTKGASNDFIAIIKAREVKYQEKLDELLDTAEAESN